MIFFRCDVSEAIGWGHLKRCITLAKYINEYSTTVFLMSRFTQVAQEAIEKIGSLLHVIPEGLAYEDEIEFYPASCQNIIVDLGHRDNLSQPNEYVKYLHALTSFDCRVVVIDGLGKESFRHKEAPMIKAYIQPYWGVPKEPRPHSEFWFQGPEFVLVDEMYYLGFKKRSSSSVKNLLITFGGSDPQENTIKVLNGVVNSINSLNIRVIIGPSFSPALINCIKKTAFGSVIDLVVAPKNLLEHYQWADLGICGSGTTRYEAAAIGLPVIFTSIYPEHNHLSNDYASFGTSEYLGPDVSLAPTDWRAAILKMQVSPTSYENMVTAIETMRQVNFGGRNLAAQLKEVFKI